jgi:predicted acylesterase/phospholipase RssA
MKNDQPPNADIALCLSGGGLRATLFHLGLIKALRTHVRNGRRALDDVREIYSVSGGSILAAHLVRNWEHYAGSDDQFAEMEKKILAFARRDVRNRVVRRWLVSGVVGLAKLAGWDRGFWLRREYQKLLGTGPIEESYTKTQKPPALFILATSFKTGELCSFSPTDFEIMRRDDQGHVRPVGAPCAHLPLAYAVAVSSAFPPLFPPIPLTDHMLGNPASDEFRVPLHLSDGGVYDNLGFEMFRLRHENSTNHPATLIVSNAGGSFRSAVGEDFSSIVSRNIRASDILMRRVAESTEEAFKDVESLNRIALRIGRTGPGSLPLATQQRLRLVRTDLDRFEPRLAEMLVDHGLHVGTMGLTENGFASVRTPPKPLTQDAPEVLDKAAARGARQSWLALFVDIKDRATIPFLAALALMLSPLILSIYFAYTKYSVLNKNMTDLIEQIEDVTIKKELGSANPEDIGFSAAKYINFQKAMIDSIQKSSDSEIEKEPASSSNTVPPISGNPPFPPDPVASSSTIDRKAYKVWIQFAGTLKREDMITFGRQIKLLWPNAPGAEQGGERTGKSANMLEVRHNPADKAAAEVLTQDILRDTTFKKMDSPKATSIIPKGSLEIWVSDRK